MPREARLANDRLTARKRHADVFTDIRPIHWNMNLACIFAPRHLELLQHLQECGYLRIGMALRDKKCMTL